MDQKISLGLLEPRWLGKVKVGPKLDSVAAFVAIEANPASCAQAKSAAHSPVSQFVFHIGKALNPNILPSAIGRL